MGEISGKGKFYNSKSVDNRGRYLFCKFNLVKLFYLRDLNLLKGAQHCLLHFVLDYAGLHSLKKKGGSSVVAWGPVLA